MSLPPPIFIDSLSDAEVGLMLDDDARSSDGQMRIRTTSRAPARLTRTTTPPQWKRRPPRRAGRRGRSRDQLGSK